MGEPRESWTHSTRDSSRYLSAQHHVPPGEYSYSLLPCYPRVAGQPEKAEHKKIACGFSFNMSEIFTAL